MSSPSALTFGTRHVLVTGANGGIGSATCEHLARDGFGHVIMAGRSAARLDAARGRVLADAGAAPSTVTTAAGFDMLDPAAIHEAVDRLPATPLDVVFLQAGGWVVAPTYPTHTIGGHTYERTSFQNVFGGHTVLAALEATGRLQPRCRIVVMGGEGARGVPGSMTPVAFPTPDAVQTYLRGSFDGLPDYTALDGLATSKLVSALWTLKLAALDIYDVVWFSPGFTGGTGGTSGLPAWQQFVFQRLAFPILVALGKAQWPDAAAQRCADAVTGIVGTHGEMLGAPAGAALGPLTDQKPMLSAYADAAFHDAVWDIAVEVGGPLGG